MVSRDRVIRTLNHQSIDRAPRDLWLLPGLEACRPDDVAEINVRFPSDILHVEAKGPAGIRSKDHSVKTGSLTDAWGCTWQLGNHGVLTGLMASPLADLAAVAAYEPPAELLEPVRFGKINPICEGSGRFTLANTEVRPLDRLRQLRGPETAASELCDGNQDLRTLLEKLHDFFKKEIDLWASTQVDGVIIGDDLAWVATSQAHLEIWRSLFRPLYQEYCAAAHDHDKFVFFLCGGPSGEALDDLVEIGIDAVHAQWPPDEFKKLADRYRGQVTFWGGVERERIEPPCRDGDICEAVFRVRKALDFGAGGVISQVSWGNHIPLRNIITFFEQWMVPLSVTV